MTEVKIAILGFGTVGSGVGNILQDNREIIETNLHRKTGREISILVEKILVRNPSKYKNIEPEILTTDFQDILNDPSITIIVELIGGTDYAPDYILQSLERGKHVVSANKKPLLIMERNLKAVQPETEWNSCTKQV